MSTPARHGGGSLPRYLTSFIGRQHEIAEITGLLLRDDVRLLTLIGPGGAGKTRLAVETVGRVDPAIWDDVWFVSLVSVREPELVLLAIAQALGLQQAKAGSVGDTINHVLAERHALLLIDNFEHVTAAAPDLGRILAACPGITMLVTSRVALHMYGEHLFMLPPLEIPQDVRIPLERLRAYESIELFLQRSLASGRKLDLTDDNAASIATICRRLDGLPLALELAAARSGILSPDALLALLERGAGILSGGPHDMHDRHRSLHDAIAWSYDLLPSQEQAAFRRLAVFDGGFSLAAAEAIIDLPIDVMEVIASLAAKSLLSPIDSETGQPRFTMLETIREFGLERLTMEGESSAVRDRHAAYFLQEAIAGEYAWCMYLEDGLMWLGRLAADHANMREALAWFERRGEILSCLRMAGALAPLWAVCGNLDEGRMWLERLLADQRVIDDAIRANGLATLSWVLNERWVLDGQNQADKAFELAEEIIALSRKIDIPLEAIRGHVLSGIAASDLGQHTLAEQRLETAIALMNTPGLPDWMPNFIQNTMVMLGYIELRAGYLESAETWFNDAYVYDINRGYEPGTGHILGSIVFSGLTWIARIKGDAPRALQFSQQYLRLNKSYPNINFSIHAICDIAGALAALGQYTLAARLFGASEALHDLYGYDFVESFDIQRAAGLPEPWARESDPFGTAERLRDALTPRTVSRLPSTVTLDALSASWAEGRKLSLDEAVTEALAATVQPFPVYDVLPMHGLSPREIEVLRLVAEGQSNRAIAESLSLSERTIEHHVTHILTKLDLDSRTAAATFAVRNGLAEA